MFFDDNLPNFNPDFIQFYRQFKSQSEGNPYVTNSGIPTHTEDGIPIRKLYISNLPANTTRSELFGLFAQYGFIKSCWLKMSEFGVKSAPTYAFITFKNPTDAFRALAAPSQEKSLRGRDLKVSPADSWHQPTEDCNGVLQWNKRNQRHSNENHNPDPENSNCNEDGANSESAIKNINNEDPINKMVDSNISGHIEQKSCSILDILNMDCLTYILDYISIRELILTERVSKQWQNMLQQYYSNIHVYKTSWWPTRKVVMTTAVLRHVLERVGSSLRRLQIDNMWCSLNDRAAHAIGKFCPELEELEVVNMYTKNWNPVLYGCKKLKSVSFLSCNKVTDLAIANLIKQESNIINITVTSNSQVSGLFLTIANLERIQSLAFNKCQGLQGSVLYAAATLCPNLTTLRLDWCPQKLWSVVPHILEKLPNLIELSLAGFRSRRNTMTSEDEGAFGKVMAKLNKLKRLNLHNNMWVTNAVLQQIAESCPYLEHLNVSGYFGRNGNIRSGIGNAGVMAVCRSCTVLSRLDISNLPALTNAGLRYLPRLSCLTHLGARGNRTLTAPGIVPCLSSCHRLVDLDVCGCRAISTEELYNAALASVNAHPRLLKLRLAGTYVESECELPLHKLISVETLCSNSVFAGFSDITDLLLAEYTDDDGDDDGLYYSEDDDFMNGIHGFVDPGNMDELDDFFQMIDHDGPELVML